jgi:hypothetical protein
MSIPHTATLSAHRTFSELEQEYSTQSISSSTNKTATVIGEDDQSMRLQKYPPSYQDTQHKSSASIDSSIGERMILEDETADSIMTKKKRRWMVFRRIAYIVIMNAAIPIALYYILKSHLPAVWALVLSSTPTIISVIVQAIFMKRIDSIGVAVIFGIV